MIDLIQEPISVLCEEVGISVPQPDGRGVLAVVIDGQEIRYMGLKQNRIAMVGVIGDAAAIAERRREDLQGVLASCLTLQGARFGKLGAREILTLEPETGELVAWFCFDGTGMSISGFLSATESMLNEMEFWKNWLAVY